MFNDDIFKREFNLRTIFDDILIFLSLRSSDHRKLWNFWNHSPFKIYSQNSSFWLFFWLNDDCCVDDEWRLLLWQNFCWRFLIAIVSNWFIKCNSCKLYWTENVNRTRFEQRHNEKCVCYDCDDTLRILYNVWI